MSHEFETLVTYHIMSDQDHVMKRGDVLDLPGVCCNMPYYRHDKNGKLSGG